MCVVWSDEGRWGGGGGADEHCTTKQGHSEGQWEKQFRPHPPCFLSLHEMKRRRKNLLLFTDRLPYLELKLQTGPPAVRCLMFQLLLLFLYFLEKFLFQTRNSGRKFESPRSKVLLKRRRWITETCCRETFQSSCRQGSNIPQAVQTQGTTIPMILSDHSMIHQQCVQQGECSVTFCNRSIEQHQTEKHLRNGSKRTWHLWRRTFTVAAATNVFQYVFPVQLVWSHF